MKNFRGYYHELILSVRICFLYQILITEGNISIPDENTPLYCQSSCTVVYQAKIV